MSNNLEETYKQRFLGMEATRSAVWQVLCKEYFQKFVRPGDTVLDVGAGYCEFINNIEAAQKYALDLNPTTTEKANPGITVLMEDLSRAWSLKSESIDVAFSSNFFEHLPTKEVLLHCFQEMHRLLKPGGTLIAMGPNIRFCYDVYWDFFDHHLALSDRSIEEALKLNGFDIECLIPQFLPFSMQGGPPPSPLLLSIYLRLPVAWRFFGKQFLVIAHKT